MEMREIEVFLTLAEELHFGRAADRLHRTTSHVSQTIRLLERRIGGPLFERSSRRVALTPLGERLLADLGPAYQAIQDAVAAAQRAAHRTPGAGTLRVAATQTVPPELLDGVAEAFRRSRPAARVVWHTMPYDQYYAFFGDGEPPGGTDILFCWVPSVSPQAVPRSRLMVGPVLSTSSRVLLMSEDHPLAGRASVDIEELAGHKVLYPVVPNEHFADAWVPPVTPGGRPIERVDLHFIFPERLSSIMAEGLLHVTGVSIYWRAIGYPGLVTVPLTGLPPLLLVSVWQAAADSDLIRAFAESTAGRPAPGVTA
jgi:DNA-binding transcriptional LysR family regulator